MLSLSSVEEEEQSGLTGGGRIAERQVPPPGEKLHPPPWTQSIEGVIQGYLQDLVAGGRRLKTLEWHRTALQLFQQYLSKERALFLLSQLSEADIDGWITSLRTIPTARGPIVRQTR